MNQPTPDEIAQRLLDLRERCCSPRRKFRSLFITKIQFNRVAGRQKIEDAILVPVRRWLRRSQLQLVRVDGGFALLDASTIESWTKPRAPDLRHFTKLATLSPAAAWPFPTANKA